MAGLLNNLGHLQVKLKRLDLALGAFQSAARVFEEIGDRVNAAWQEGNCGSVCRDRGEHDEALDHYHRALAVFGELGPRVGVVDQASNDEALDHYHRALAVFGELGPRVGVVDQASNIGYIHAMKGEVPEAIGWFEKARQGYEALGEKEKAGLAARNIEVLRAHSGKP